MAESSLLDGKFCFHLIFFHLVVYSSLKLRRCLSTNAVYAFCFEIIRFGRI